MTVPGRALSSEPDDFDTRDMVEVGVLSYQNHVVGNCSSGDPRVVDRSPPTLVPESRHHPRPSPTDSKVDRHRRQRPGLPSFELFSTDLEGRFDPAGVLASEFRQPPDAADLTTCRDQSRPAWFVG